METLGEVVEEIEPSIVEDITLESRVLPADPIIETDEPVIDFVLSENPETGEIVIESPPRLLKRLFSRARRMMRILLTPRSRVWRMAKPPEPPLPPTWIRLLARMSRPLHRLRLPKLRPLKRRLSKRPPKLTTRPLRTKTTTPNPNTTPTTTPKSPRSSPKRLPRLIDVSEQALHARRAQPESADLRSALKRPMHTLKGGARMAGVIPMGDLSHELETLVMQMDSGLVPTTAATFELLQTCLDELARQRDAVAASQPVAHATKLIRKIHSLSEPPKPKAAKPAAAASKPAAAAPSAPTLQPVAAAPAALTANAPVAPAAEVLQ